MQNDFARRRAKRLRKLQVERSISAEVSRQLRTVRDGVRVAADASSSPLRPCWLRDTSKTCFNKTMNARMNKHI